MAITKNGSTPQFVNASLVPSGGIAVSVAAGAGADDLTSAISLSAGLYGFTSTGSAIASVKVNGTAITTDVFTLGASGGTQLAVTPITQWTTRTSFTTTNLNRVAYSSTATHPWVLVGANGNTTPRSSTDGITWTSRTFNVNSGVEGLGAGSGTIKFVASLGDGTVRTSTDGITWVSRTPPTGGSVGYGVVEGDGIWVMVGSGGSVFTSTDTITWTTRTSNTTNALYSIAYSTNFVEKYVAVGSGGKVHSSTDAITWTTRTPNASDAFYGVATNGTLYFAVGDIGQIRESTDAITWVTRTANGAPVGFKAYDVNFIGTKWVIVGSAGTILNSTDGTTWTLRQSNYTSDFKSVAGIGSFAVTVGNSGTVRSAPNNGDGASLTDFGAVISGPLSEITLS